MVTTTSNTHGKQVETEQVKNVSSNDELRREAELVASGGVISKRTMAIAFGLVFLLVALMSASALGVWGGGSLGLLGLVLIIWGLAQMIRKSAGVVI